MRAAPSCGGSIILHTIGRVESTNIVMLEHKPERVTALQITEKEYFRQATQLRPWAGMFAWRTAKWPLWLDQKLSQQKTGVGGEGRVRSEMEFGAGKTSRVLKWAMEMGSQDLVGSKGEPGLTSTAKDLLLLLCWVRMEWRLCRRLLQ